MTPDPQGEASESPANPHPGARASVPLHKEATTGPRRRRWETSLCGPPEVFLPQEVSVEGGGNLDQGHVEGPTNVHLKGLPWWSRGQMVLMEAVGRGQKRQQREDPAQVAST